MAIITSKNRAEKINEARNLLDYLSAITDNADAIIRLVQANQDWFDARPGQDALEAAKLKLEKLLDVICVCGHRRGAHKGNAYECATLLTASCDCPLFRIPAHAPDDVDYLLAQQLEGAHQEIAQAIAILNPSMPESGLEDACRQLAQAYITERDNAETADKLLATAEKKLDETGQLKQDYYDEAKKGWEQFRATKKKLGENERELRLEKDYSSSLRETVESNKYQLAELRKQLGERGAELGKADNEIVGLRESLLAAKRKLGEQCGGQEGCFLGLLAEQDDVLCIDEFQKKHLGKRDLGNVDWFTFCPTCGRTLTTAKQKGK